MIAASNSRVTPPTWQRIDVDGEVSCWLVVETKVQDNAKAWRKCELLVLSRQPEGKGDEGSGAVRPRGIVIDEADVIAEIRRWRARH